MILKKYYSTNHISHSNSFKEILIQGQAPDKGLFMPTTIPRISPEAISKLPGMSYPEIAFVVLNEFLKDEIAENDLRNLLEDAYNFDVPLEKISGQNFILRLDRGPTASFKDFAARAMARLIYYFYRDPDKNLTILTATSGDTGSAVANAFFKLDGINVFILFPKNEVSEKQRKQMTTLDHNVAAIAIDGKFDDCQAIVKRAFGDPELSHLHLTSANSINFGRLLAQTVYYFYSYSRAAENGEQVIFSVPSGNFGDLMGGLLAKKMGLPVYKFIAATNENDEFAKFLETGQYQPITPSKNCISNAMNVGHPSNLARIIDLYGGQMDPDGTINQIPDMDSMRRDIFAISITDDQTRQTIKDAYEKNRIILEPHGAVAWAALEKFKAQDSKPAIAISLETANPAKFPDEIEGILNIHPEIPGALKDLDSKKEFMQSLPASYDSFKEFLVLKECGKGVCII